MLDFIPVVAAEGGLDSLQVVFKWLMASVADVVTTIVTTPILLLPVGLFVGGGVIGLTKRFIGR